MHLYSILFTILLLVNIFTTVSSQTITVTGLDATQRQEALDEHNRVRAEVCQADLTYSQTLEDYAVAYLVSRVGDGSFTCGGFPAHSSGPYGENIAYRGGSSPPSVTSLVLIWNNEKKDFDCGTLPWWNGGVAGHYSQNVWDDTTQVGCAYASCQNGYTNGYLLCSYDPPGNWNVHSTLPFDAVYCNEVCPMTSSTTSASTSSTTSATTSSTTSTPTSSTTSTPTSSTTSTPTSSTTSATTSSTTSTPTSSTTSTPTSSTTSTPTSSTTSTPTSSTTSTPTSSTTSNPSASTSATTATSSTTSASDSATSTSTSATSDPSDATSSTSSTTTSDPTATRDTTETATTAQVSDTAVDSNAIETQSSSTMVMVLFVSLALVLL